MHIKEKSLSVLVRLMRSYLRPYIGQLCIAFFFMLIAASSTAGFAKLLQPVLDQLFIGIQDNPSHIPKVWKLGGAIFLCFFLSGIATYLHTIKMNKVSQSIVADIQKDVFAHFMKMNLSFFHAHPSGQLVSRITNDVNVMRGAVSDSLTGIGKNLLTLILLIAVMMYQDWTLALLTLSIFPLVGGMVALIGKRLRKLSHSIQSETADLMDTLISIFQGIRQVQAYNTEAFESQRSSKAVDNVKRLNIKAVRIATLSTPLNEIMIGLVLFGIILYGTYAIASGTQTPGGLMSFIAAFSLAYEPMKKLAKLNNTLQLGIGASDRVLKLLDIAPSITDTKDAKPLTTHAPTIQFENVEFEYAQSEGEKALNTITCEIEGGKVTALVGASGSGKTTILNLIPRFYDVTSGSIQIDTIDIKNITLKSLRENIALVSQDITIFNESVSANIAYGAPHATEDEIIKASKMAAADQFILDMPEGYDTKLGENGVKLSGGQKQRLSIARAILRDAPILLLDEATSALDTHSESLIQDSLKALEKGRTTLIVAHRLSTIQHADKIIVLEKGQIVEQGTHEALMRKQSVYSQLYNQYKGENSGEF